MFIHLLLANKHAWNIVICPGCVITLCFTTICNHFKGHILISGNEELDQVVKVMLGTAMFVGGFIGFILDNTVPGNVSYIRSFFTKYYHLQFAHTRSYPRVSGIHVSFGFWNYLCSLV